jgi:hypothetical protein
VFEVCLLIIGLVLMASFTGMFVDIFDYEVNAVGSKVMEDVAMGAVKLEEIETRLVRAARDGDKGGRARQQEAVQRSSRSQ